MFSDIPELVSVLTEYSHRLGKYMWIPAILTAVTLLAVLVRASGNTRRDTLSPLLWFAVCVSFPAAGPLAYILFSILPSLFAGRDIHGNMPFSFRLRRNHLMLLSAAAAIAVIVGIIVKETDASLWDDANTLRIVMCAWMFTTAADFYGAVCGKSLVMSTNVQAEGTAYDYMGRIYGQLPDLSHDRKTAGIIRRTADSIDDQVSFIRSTRDQYDDIIFMRDEPIMSASAEYIGKGVIHYHMRRPDQRTDTGDVFERSAFRVLVKGRYVIARAAVTLATAVILFHPAVYGVFVGLSEQIVNLMCRVLNVA
jgi:hypothetical protein